jgi:predicted enzyme related to lactoylglutathione lyase
VDGFAFLTQYAQVQRAFAKKWADDLRFCSDPSTTQGRNDPRRRRLRYRVGVTSPIRIVEFPADDSARARRFWTGVLGVELRDRADGEGEGWQTGGDGPALGVHQRGTGPGDRVSLPYFRVSDMDATLSRVRELGGEVVHPGERWSVCRDSEGSPFGLALDEPS